MELKEVYKNLCIGDERHPDYDKSGRTCASLHNVLPCNNCHTGRNALALEIIALKEEMIPLKDFCDSYM